MALEITRFLSSGEKVLDVGCGNGFIAHHLNSLLGNRVVGLDVSASTIAQIDYLPFDGQHFPLADNSFDAVLLCYVLHHAQDSAKVLTEVHRVLKENGRVIVYEDNPSGWWDRAVCWIHNLQWQGRTGQCTFQPEHEWSRVFSDAGFQVLGQRGLSRWRNFAHPVARNFFVLEARSVALSRLESWPKVETRAA